jgi:hypothetical protein
MPVESLFPQGGSCIELASSSGWSRVLGIDAVGGSPNCDFANEGGGMTSCCSPGWRTISLAGVVLDLVGEVGDKLGSLCQVAAPNGIGMEREWNAREPGQRTWLGRRQRWEAPVEDGRHVAYGFEVTSGGGCQCGCFPVSAARASRWARRVGQAGSAVSLGMYWSAWSSSATVWAPRSCSAATCRPSV